MRIQVFFQFMDQKRASACTGVEDGATDLLMPQKGDLVTHKDVMGNPFCGRVTERTFAYDLPRGEEVQGTISITLLLERLPLPDAQPSH